MGFQASRPVGSTRGSLMGSRVSFARAMDCPTGAFNRPTERPTGFDMGLEASRRKFRGQVGLGLG